MLRIFLLFFIGTFLCCKEREPTNSHPDFEGGRKVRKSDFAATVSLQSYDLAADEFKHFCTAARIGGQLFLTAAHCVINRDKRTVAAKFLPGVDLRLFFGSSKDSKDPNKDSADVHVEYVAVHPSYLTAIEFNGGRDIGYSKAADEKLLDIAVIKIQESLPENVIRIAEIVFATEIAQGLGVRVGGYGKIGEDKNNVNLDLMYERLAVDEVSGSLFYIPVLNTINGVSKEVRIREGDSGGPVYLDTKVLGSAEEFYGKIIGVNAKGSTLDNPDKYSAFARLDDNYNSNSELPEDWIKSLGPKNHESFAKIDRDFRLSCNVKTSNVEFSFAEVSVQAVLGRLQNLPSEIVADVRDLQNGSVAQNLRFKRNLYSGVDEFFAEALDSKKQRIFYKFEIPSSYEVGIYLFSGRDKKALQTREYDDIPKGTCFLSMK